VIVNEFHTAGGGQPLVTPKAGRSGSCSVRHKTHRNSIDAVAQMGRWRAIIKDVAKMASAIRAVNLGSHHTEGSINQGLDGILDRIVPVCPSLARSSVSPRAE
jgi:hypothetical protein